MPIFPNQDAQAVANERSTTVWTAVQRESFFQAIARNRRAAFRVTLAGWLCGALFVTIFAVLTAPLLIGLLVLVVDLVNLLHPLPDLVALATPSVRALAHSRTNLPATRWAEILALLSVPGIILASLAMLALRRALSRCITLDAADCTRAPDQTRLAEQRLVNVVSEMALAAQIPEPEVCIAASPQINALIVGTDGGRLTLVATEGLLENFSREAMEGTVAHLIGSAANGDLRIARRFAVDVIAGAIMMRPSGRGHALHGLRMLATAVISPRRLDAAALRDWLAARRGATSDGSASAGDTRRSAIATLFTLFLMGPWMAGFFFDLACAFFIFPLLALAWQRRKYLADATAVRLTRDPDALAGALGQLQSRGKAGFGADPVALLMAHLAQHPEDATHLQEWLDTTATGMAALPAHLASNPRFAIMLADARHRRAEIEQTLKERAQSDPRIAAALAAPRQDWAAETRRSDAGIFAPQWQAHMAAFRGSGVPGLGLMVDPVPAIEPRLKRLAKLGAHLHEAPRSMNMAARLIIGAFLAPLALLMMVVVGLSAYLSAILSGAFTLIPILLLHIFLRWLAAH
jgi:Zn-dependent protease with chaperone function